jgi:hypothetical protein
MSSEIDYDNLRRMDQIILGFNIFKKYPDSDHLHSSHDELHAGPDENIVSAEDIVELEKLGWHAYGDFGFTFFT